MKPGWVLAFRRCSGARGSAVVTRRIRVSLKARDERSTASARTSRPEQCFHPIPALGRAEKLAARRARQRRAAFITRNPKCSPAAHLKRRRGSARPRRARGARARRRRRGRHRSRSRSPHRGRASGARSASSPSPRRRATKGARGSGSTSPSPRRRRREDATSRRRRRRARRTGRPRRPLVATTSWTTRTIREGS